MTPKNLKSARLQLGLSQAELGALLDIPSNTIARWERGALRIVHPTLLRLAIEHLACIKTSRRR